MIDPELEESAQVLKPERQLRLVVFANSIMESGTMHGGYRIFIECLRHWLREGHTAQLITSVQGKTMVRRYLQSPNLSSFTLGPNGSSGKTGSPSLWHSAFLQLLRTLTGIAHSLKAPKCTLGAVIYSTTPFWPDLFPALILRWRNPGTVWLVALSMFAPPVFGGWRSGVHPGARRLQPRALALKMNEVTVYSFIRRWADLVYVNNSLDLDRIREDGMTAEQTLVVGGGIDVELSDSVHADGAIEHDAVFVGRFHPQKGVLELIDIWLQVCQLLPKARLVMIGNGPLEDDVAHKVVSSGMGSNIAMVGFKDGEDKIQIFRRSRIVLHPALYESGGMAAAEAMVCGLPGVSYDLPALETYYPTGMLKAQDQAQFVEHIVRLLTDHEFYQKISQDAEAWARSWDWRQVSQDLMVRLQLVSQNNRKIQNAR